MRPPRFQPARNSSPAPRTRQRAGRPAALVVVLIPLMAAPASPARAQGAPAAAQGGAQPAAAEAQYAAAAALTAAKKWAEAVPALEKLVTAFPGHALALQARLRLGEAHLALARPDAALKAFEAVLASAKKALPAERAEALIGAGRAHLALKAEAKAATAWSDAYDLTEFDETLGPAAGLLLGDLLFRQEKYSEAEKAFYRVTRWPAHPEAPRAYFLVAESHRLSGSLRDAAFAYRTMVERYPRDPGAARAALAAGDAFLALGQLQDAEAEYQRVLRRYTTSAQAPRAQLGLGRTAYRGARYEIARAAYQAAALLFAEVAREAELRIADCYLAEKNVEEARARYRALAAGPDRSVASEASYTLALTYRDEGKPAPAADGFRTLGADRAAGRWSQLARLRLAEIRLAGGDPGSAGAALRSVLAENPEPEIREEAAYRVAEILARRGDYGPAETELAPLVRAPGAGYPLGVAAFGDRASVLLARCRLEQKDAAAAMGRLADLLKKELPGGVRAAALTVLGRAQIVAKQEAAGVGSLREVLEKHGADASAPEAARALLVYYRERKQHAQALEMERLMVQRYAGAGVAVEGLLEEAGRQLQAGSYEEAAAAYARVLERRPEPEARLKARAGIAEASVFLKRRAAVDEQLQDALQDAAPPVFLARLHYRIGLAWEKTGRPDEALAAFNAARAGEPDDDTGPLLLFAVGRVCADTKKPAQAEAALRALLDRYPKSPLAPDALYGLAWTFVDRGKQDRALPLFQRLATEFAAHPLAADACFRLGEAEYARGQHAAAGEHYRKAADSKEPVADRALYKLGWALRQAGDPAGAARAFLGVSSRFPRSDLALESRVRAGEAYLQMEKTAEALAELEPLLAAAPRDVEEGRILLQARVAAAEAVLRGGDPARARELAEPAAQAANGWLGGRAQLIRAAAIAAKDGPKAAAGEFGKAASLWGRYRDVAAEAGFRLGECYEKLGNTPGARAAWQRVVDLYRGTGWDRRCEEKLTGKSTVTNIGL